MIELSISQAQTQFTKLLQEAVLIIDKKSHKKKAVILPYEEYKRLVAKALGKEDFQEGSFGKFVGSLDAKFETDDARYNEIIK